MSHFTKLARAQITSAEAFIAACAELGMTTVTRETVIKDYFGATLAADVAVRVGNYDIGLVKNESGKFDMVADWWGVRKALPPSLGYVKTDTDLQDAILRNTTKHAIMQKYKRMGFRADFREDEAHNITLNLSKF